MQIEAQNVWADFNRSDTDRIQLAVDNYNLQLQESITSFSVTSQQAKWDTGQASAPSMKKLMAAYAQRLALLPEDEQYELIHTELQVWKRNFSPFDRSFVIALGNGLREVFEHQGSEEWQSEYLHRLKLRFAYKNMINVIVLNLRERDRVELRLWIQNYHVF